MSYLTIKVDHGIELRQSKEISREGVNVQWWDVHVAPMSSLEERQEFGSGDATFSSYDGRRNCQVEDCAAYTRWPGENIENQGVGPDLFGHIVQGGRCGVSGSVGAGADQRTTKARTELLGDRVIITSNGHGGTIGSEQTDVGRDLRSSREDQGQAAGPKLGDQADDPGYCVCR